MNAPKTEHEANVEHVMNHQPINPPPYSPAEKRFLCETAQKFEQARFAQQGTVFNTVEFAKSACDRAKELLSELKARGWFEENLTGEISGIGLGEVMGHAVMPDGERIPLRGNPKSSWSCKVCGFGLMASNYSVCPNCAQPREFDAPTIDEELDRKVREKAEDQGLIRKAAEYSEAELKGEHSKPIGLEVAQWECTGCGVQNDSESQECANCSRSRVYPTY